MDLEKERCIIGVPVKLWNQMGEHGQKLCSAVWRELGNSPVNISHPNAAPMPSEHWSVLRYNAAVVAGLALSGMVETCP